MSTRQTILDALARIADEQQAELVEGLDDNTVLLESGLDSLGFALLVAELEDLFGFDPFVEMENPVYPETLGEFVAIYERRAVVAGSTPD